MTSTLQTQIAEKTKTISRSIPQFRRVAADGLIVVLRVLGSVHWKYEVIRWGYGKQSDQAW